MPHKVQIAAENRYHPEMKKKTCFQAADVFADSPV
jgi:hypothetical protein